MGNESQSSSPTPAHASQQGRVLIVDDEPNLMTALCAMLAERGYETQGLTLGEEALTLLREQDFDVLHGHSSTPLLPQLRSERTGKSPGRTIAGCTSRKPNLL